MESPNLTWVRPESTANTNANSQPVYPYNSVRQFECGGFEEFDSTPGRERHRVQHKTGTYIEMAPNGDKVQKIMGSDYQVVANNKNVLIKGSCIITIEGNTTLHIKGDSHQQVEGAVYQNIVGKVEQLVQGGVKQTVSGDYDLTASGKLTLSASKVNINSGLFVRGDICGNQSISAQGNVTAVKNVSARVSIQAGTFVQAGTYMQAGTYGLFGTSGSFGTSLKVGSSIKAGSSIDAGGNISAGGNIRAGGLLSDSVGNMAGAYANPPTSDYRLKTVYSNLNNSGEIIDSLKPKEGIWNDDGSKFVGFLAHEFAEVLPSRVFGEKDAVDENGEPIYQRMQSADNEVIAYLVAEIQSLRKRLAEVENKIGE